MWISPTRVCALVHPANAIAILLFYPNAHLISFFTYLRLHVPMDHHPLAAIVVHASAVPILTPSTLLRRTCHVDHVLQPLWPQLALVVRLCRRIRSLAPRCGRGMFCTRHWRHWYRIAVPGLRGVDTVYSEDAAAHEIPKEATQARYRS